MIGDSDDKTNLPNKLLLTDRQVVNPCKSFASKWLVNIKPSKIQLFKIVQSGSFTW